VTGLKGVGVYNIGAPGRGTSRLKGVSMIGYPQGLPESLGDFLFSVARVNLYRSGAHSNSIRC